MTDLFAGRLTLYWREGSFFPYYLHGTKVCRVRERERERRKGEEELSTGFYFFQEKNFVKCLCKRWPLHVYIRRYLFRAVLLVVLFYIIIVVVILSLKGRGNPKSKTDPQTSYQKRCLPDSLRLESTEVKSQVCSSIWKRERKNQDL